MDFKFVHVWKLLKDEPKCIDVATSYEPEPISPLVRPMGQKAAKRKAKEKVTETSSSNINLTRVEDQLRGKNASTMRVARAKEIETNNKMYPEWTAFVKTIPMPQAEKRQLFSKRQESARKDVERAFGVLQSRFAIVRGPARAWRLEAIKHIMYVCIILHNMIVEDERHTYAGNYDYDHIDVDGATAEVSSGAHPLFETYIQRRTHVRGRQNYQQLQTDLVEHIWERFRHESREN